MKPLLLSLAISTVLFSRPGLAADPVVTVQAAPTQVAAASQELRMKAPLVLTTAAPLSVVDASGPVGSVRLVDAPRGAESTSSEGLPSTPIALATLLLMLCILIGRRNT